jgi:hypothetical protein
MLHLKVAVAAGKPNRGCNRWRSRLLQAVRPATVASRVKHLLNSMSLSPSALRPPRLRLQWLFLIEGVPSVLLGVAIAVWLPSSPLSAAMLTEEERVLLHEKVNTAQQVAARMWQCVAPCHMMHVCVVQRATLQVAAIWLTVGSMLYVHGLDCRTAQKRLSSCQLRPLKQHGSDAEETGHQQLSETALAACCTTTFVSDSSACACACACRCMAAARQQQQLVSRCAGATCWS